MTPKSVSTLSAHAPDESPNSSQVGDKWAEVSRRVSSAIVESGHSKVWYSVKASGVRSHERMPTEDGTAPGMHGDDDEGVPPDSLEALKLQQGGDKEQTTGVYRWSEPWRSALAKATMLVESRRLTRSGSVDPSLLAGREREDEGEWRSSDSPPSIREAGDATRLTSMGGTTTSTSPIGWTAEDTGSVALHATSSEDTLNGETCPNWVRPDAEGLSDVQHSKEMANGAARDATPAKGDRAPAPDEAGFPSSEGSCPTDEYDPKGDEAEHDATSPNGSSNSESRTMGVSEWAPVGRQSARIGWEPVIEEEEKSTALEHHKGAQVDLRFLPLLACLTSSAKCFSIYFMLKEEGTTCALDVSEV